jgi:hypothetical protein
VDILEAGIRKLNALAEDRGLEIPPQGADISDYRSQQGLDPVASHGCLHLEER